jgi:hypothetical protein
VFLWPWCRTPCSILGSNDSSSDSADHRNEAAACDSYTGAGAFGGEGPLCGVAVKTPRSVVLVQSTQISPPRHPLHIL